jgi:hypothetical protein
MAKEESTVELLKGAKKDKIFEVEGAKIRVIPVSALLIQEITSQIDDPRPPMQPNLEKDGRMEENPFDPDYLDKLKEAQQKRSQATSDALVMFGLELVDGLPEDETWIKKLRWLEKTGRIDLSYIDFNDPFEKDFAFKKFIAATNPTIMEVTRASGVSQEDIDNATASFQRNTTQ